MKIIYCIAATYNSGGMERVLANKVNWLTRHAGVECVVVTSDQCGRKPFFEFDKRVRHIDLGINYEANNGRGFLNKLIGYPLRQWRHRRRLSALLRREKADITVSMFCNEAALLPDIKDGSRKLLEVHFSRFKRLQYGRTGMWAIADRLRSRGDLRTARRYDRFVTLTREDMGYWPDVPGIEAIPNAVPFEAPAAADLSQRKVLAVGRLSHQKGFDRLIEAWRDAVAANPGWTLEIVGSGELHDELKRQIEENGVADSVVMTSGCSDMPAKYREASILAMTSRYEGLPMALIEGQACGLPIVAMDCKCGPRDVVTDGSDGFITPQGDTATFADRLSQLMSDADLRVRMGAEARRQAKRFDPDKIMTRWMEIFRELERYAGRDCGMPHPSET